MIQYTQATPEGPRTLTVVRYETPLSSGLAVRVTADGKFLGFCDFDGDELRLAVCEWEAAEAVPANQLASLEAAFSSGLNAVRRRDD